jgi:hypothetical protein
VASWRLAWLGITWDEDLYSRVPGWTYKEYAYKLWPRVRRTGATAAELLEEKRKSALKRA